MKKIALSLFSLLFICLVSCAKVGLVRVTPAPQERFSGNVFENDTVTVTYNLWADGGVVRFSIYNKLDIPIYVDWKNSAFIPNENKIAYWSDVSDITTVTNSQAYYYGGATAVSTSTASRAEVVSSIPPRSKITKATFLVVPHLRPAKLEPYRMADIVPGKIIKGKKGEFSVNNSPLVFRNYLTLSTSQNPDKGQFYVDNTMYVSFIASFGEHYMRAVPTSGLNFYYYQIMYNLKPAYQVNKMPVLSR